jgi:hypothetical protein
MSMQQWWYDDYEAKPAEIEGKLATRSPQISLEEVVWVSAVKASV